MAEYSDAEFANAAKNVAPKRLANEGVLCAKGSGDAVIVRETVCTHNPFLNGAWSSVCDYKKDTA